MENGQDKIFKEVAMMAGDIVFKYDSITNKFMQYSDKPELSKYGSWIFDLENALVISNMIHPDDVQRYKVIIRRIKQGDSGTIEGLFRMKIHVSSDFRWYHLLARTNFFQGEAVEVIGRIMDINEFMTSFGNRFAFGITEYKELGVLDKDTFLDEIIRYGNRHKNGMSCCALFNMPAYDEIIERLTPSETGEFLTSITRRIKICFPYGSIVGRIGLHRMGVFMGGMDCFMDISSAISKVRENLMELGEKYGAKIEINAGICIEEYKEGIEAVLFEKAHSALEEANKNGLGNIVFYSDVRKEDDAEKKISKDEIIAEYALQFFKEGVTLMDNRVGNVSEEEIKDQVLYSVNALIVKFGKKYGLDRISISIREDGEYKEYSSWNSEYMSCIPAGSILRVEGSAEEIEKKVTKRIPYIVNNVAAYPDDTEYGRMIAFTAVKSVAQGRFECSTGMTGIVSIERYDEPHVWTKDEIMLFEVAKYIAEFCSKYLS